jgi:hypothetical protein
VSGIADAVRGRVPGAEIRHAGRRVLVSVTGPGRDTVEKRTRRALTALRLAGYTATLTRTYGVIEVRKR